MVKGAALTTLLLAEVVTFVLVAPELARVTTAVLLLVPAASVAAVRTQTVVLVFTAIAPLVKPAVLELVEISQPEAGVFVI
jgi:hypothetical protein